MDSLNRLVEQNHGPLVLFLFLAVIVLGLMVMAQGFALKNLKREWGGLMRGAQGGNIEVLLQDHLRARRDTEETLKQHGASLHALEKKMTSCLRYKGLIRYDAFEDTGGQQSFSLALFDEEGNGTVITGLYGRNEGRVYGKMLDGGQSDRSLTREEQKAVEAAGASRATVRIR